jgi:biotin carboxylase
MHFVIFAAPYFTENATRFIQATVGQPGVRVAVISQDPQEHLAQHLRDRIAAHWRVEDVLDTEQLVHAARVLSGHFGPIHRLYGAYEQLQVPLAEARELLGVEGMSAEAARNFRDKSRMKNVLREAGVPGAFGEALSISAPSPSQPVLIEEFITGEEHSLETISIGGRAVWHSLTHYYPTPLEVLRNPWIQWSLLLPREIDGPQYDDIREAAGAALTALGMDTGLTHMEWFRRRDGSVAISEVGARPPGAQITTLVSRAHDIDFLHAWARVMIYGEFDLPERRYAAGAAFLRGQGSGRVVAIHGLEQAGREVGELVTDVQLPEVGQTPTGSYEGEGYILLRHPETEVVKEALLRLISIVRVELG